MRVLVLGAGGFIGARIVASLAACDWAEPVPALHRPSAAYPNARVFDATDAAALGAALEGIDAVVNCVAGSAATMIANARALAASAGSRPVVHFSSMAVYGTAEGRIAEDAPLLANTGPYAVAKAEAEAILASLPSLMILRPGCVYGPGSEQWTARIARLLKARRIGDSGAAGAGCSNLAYVDDVCAVVLAGLAQGAHGVFNLAMPDAPDWNCYFRAFARALGLAPVAAIPAWRLKLESKLLAAPLKLAQMAHLPLPEPITPSLAGLWRQNIVLDARRADALLGGAWTPLDAGLAQAAAWISPRLALPTSR